MTFIIPFNTLVNIDQYWLLLNWMYVILNNTTELSNLVLILFQFPLSVFHLFSCDYQISIPVGGRRRRFEIWTGREVVRGSYFDLENKFETFAVPFLILPSPSAWQEIVTCLTRNKSNHHLGNSALLLFTIFSSSRFFSSCWYTVKKERDTSLDDCWCAARNSDYILPFKWYKKWLK